MEVVHERCCGLDIQKRIVVACLITPGNAVNPSGRCTPWRTPSLCWA
jgi:hypothetical protein